MLSHFATGSLYENWPWAVQNNLHHSRFSLKQPKNIATETPRLCQKIGLQFDKTQNYCNCQNGRQSSTMMCKFAWTLRKQLQTTLDYNSTSIMTQNDVFEEPKWSCSPKDSLHTEKAVSEEAGNTRKPRLCLPELTINYWFWMLRRIRGAKGDYMAASKARQLPARPQRRTKCVPNVYQIAFTHPQRLYGPSIIRKDYMQSKVWNWNTCFVYKKTRVLLRQNTDGSNSEIWHPARYKIYKSIALTTTSIR